MIATATQPLRRTCGEPRASAATLEPLSTEVARAYPRGARCRYSQIVTGVSRRQLDPEPRGRIEPLPPADISLYRPEFEQDIDHRLELLKALRDGINRDELVLHYQPKIGVHSGTVVGVEALLRWEHPKHGLLYTDTFIALAEQSGLMRRVTLTVLEQALRQIRAWSEQGLNLTVAVNISASNLVDHELPTQVSRLLESVGVRPSQLKLEITESVLVTDAARARRVLNELHRCGIGISVDDYGIGYSTLAYLQALPITELKLDPSFIIPCTTDPRSAAIVASTIALAHSLGVVIVAEGVETIDVHELLKTTGCDVLQGYLISRPLPGAQLTKWLHDQGSRTLRRNPPSAITLTPASASSRPTHTR